MAARRAANGPPTNDEPAGPDRSTGSDTAQTSKNTPTRRGAQSAGALGLRHYERLFGARGDASAARAFFEKAAAGEPALAENVVGGR